MIFLDTSFLIAVEVKGDENHRKAVEIKELIKKGEFGEAVISDYVFDETVTVTLNKTKSLEKAVFVGINLKKSSKIFGIDREIFEESWDIFRKQEKTKLSFTDCSILAVMEEKGIRDIATFDKDFKKVKDVRVVC